MEKALEVTNLHAWYGESHILHDLSLSVDKGEVVTLLGRNGAGRTTTRRAPVRPMMARSVVDLPAPLAPRMATILPAPTSKLRSVTARMAP